MEDSAQKKVECHVTNVHQGGSLRVSDIRQFSTGATRSPLGDKLQYEGFLSPVVIRRYAQYMHQHRQQSDGNIRSADNWQRGMPKDSYIDSGWRHFMDWWLHHRGASGKATEGLEESLCALMFNTMGYLHEILKESESSEVCPTTSTGDPARRLFDRFFEESPDSNHSPEVTSKYPF